MASFLSFLLVMLLFEFSHSLKKLDSSSNIATSSLTSSSVSSSTTVLNKCDAEDTNLGSKSSSSSKIGAVECINKKWILKRRPNGIFDPNEDVTLTTEKIDFTAIDDDEVVIETTVLSVDAFIRTMLDEVAYHGSIKIGDTIPAFGYGTVVYAGNKAAKKFKIGKKVLTLLGAQTHAVVKANQVFPKIDLPLMSSTACLGLTSLTSGLTAYAGMFYVLGKPKKGDTVVVTGAAGAVGNIAAQLAKTTGARVIGIAGGPNKVAFLLNELKLDGAVDYKKNQQDNSSTTSSLEQQIKETCPNGIDFIFDNVGGQTLDVLLHNINKNGRIVICGAISQYSGNLNNSKGKVQGPSNYLKLAERGATMRGFNVMQYMSKILFMMTSIFYHSIVRQRLFMREHFEDGIDSFPIALQKLFIGGHIGKMLVRIINEE